MSPNSNSSNENFRRPHETIFSGDQLNVTIDELTKLALGLAKEQGDSLTDGTDIDLLRNELTSSDKKGLGGAVIDAVAVKERGQEKSSTPSEYVLEIGAVVVSMRGQRQDGYDLAA